MFDLPRSSWADYDKALISKGGGVFARTLKEIPLSPEMKALTGVDRRQAATPAELIKALLKADVDLLWFGGIGTFIKAAAQSNRRCRRPRQRRGARQRRAMCAPRSIGEGANLGATQLGRIEYAQAGGRINTDAIDNSAGVDTSDHEVNLKILLSGPLRRGELTGEARDELLDRDDRRRRGACAEGQLRPDAGAVGRAVARREGPRRAWPLHARSGTARPARPRGRIPARRRRSCACARRTRQGPDAAGTRGAAGLCQARPRRRDRRERICPTIRISRPSLRAISRRWRSRSFPRELEQHRLRREIVTDVARQPHRQSRGTGVRRAHEGDVGRERRAGRARLRRRRRRVRALAALKTRIDALDGKVDAAVQTAMYTDIAELLRRLGLWFLANVPANADLASTIALYRAGVEALRGTFEGAGLALRGAGHRDAHRASCSRPACRSTSPTRSARCRCWAARRRSRSSRDAQGLERRSRRRRLFRDRRGRSASTGCAASPAASSATEHWDRLAIRRIIDDLFAGQRALTGDALAAARRSQGQRHARRRRGGGGGWAEAPRAKRWRAPRPSSPRSKRCGRSLHRQADARQQPDPRTGGAVGTGLVALTLRQAQGEGLSQP